LTADRGLPFLGIEMALVVKAALENGVIRGGGFRRDDKLAALGRFHRFYGIAPVAATLSARRNRLPAAVSIPGDNW
jgi:hypothetical protein